MIPNAERLAGSAWTWNTSPVRQRASVAADKAGTEQVPDWPSSTQRKLSLTHPIPSSSPPRDRPQPSGPELKTDSLRASNYPPCRLIDDARIDPWSVRVRSRPRQSSKESPLVRRVPTPPNGGRPGGSPARGESSRRVCANPSAGPANLAPGTMCGGHRKLLNSVSRASIREAHVSVGFRY